MITDIDLSKYNDANTKKNAECVPANNFRQIISGGSGSGKTVFVTNMILKYLNFDRVFIFGPSISQPAYQMLSDTFAGIDDERKQIAMKFNDNRRNKTKTMKIPEPILTMAEDLSTFNLDDLDRTQQNLIILDDLILANQKPIIKLFVRSRNMTCSCIYITQSYYPVPKIIRQSTTSVILFNPTSRRELQQLYRDIGSAIEPKIFIKTVMEALSKRFSFIKIDLTKGDTDQRYTKGLTEPLFVTS